ALIMAAADTVTAMTAYGIDFVDENDARRGFLALFEHVAHARRPDADKHFDKVRTADREKWDVGFTGDGAGQQSFAGARRSNHQDGFRNAATQFLKFLRVAQKFDQFLDFILRFFDAGDVLERDLVFVTGEHARLRFAEVESAFSGHADLLSEQK